MPAPPSAVAALKIKRAAELTAAAEEMRARFLRGDPVDQLAMVRLQGVADRAVRALSVGQEPPEGHSALADYLTADDDGEAA
jgi:hypothetical protein